MKSYLYRASNLKSTISFFGLSFIAEVNFWRPLKYIFITIIIIIINFFRQVFSEYIEANATLLIPLDTILPEICALSLVFSVRGLK